MPPRKKAAAPEASVSDYRYDAKRKNNPPAGLAAQGRVQEAPRLRYAYDPHLPPLLRFDQTAASDRVGELLAKARIAPLTAEEAQELAGMFRNREPWLEWTGKREAKWFEVDPVALHIHERVSASAVIRAAQRRDVQRDLFADPQQPYGEAVQFYRYDVDWANRLILGDSLQVMASLARREDLAGKVQMIYMDPPYGIRFASNFQPEIGRRDVKEKEQDLTREPEMVKAYRDTWNLGVHSYLAYLRDRLTLCRELLTDTGSIFLQISDENLHRVTSVMDEVFGPENLVAVIPFRKKTMPLGTLFVEQMADFVVWYARGKYRSDGRPNAKFRKLFRYMDYRPSDGYSWGEMPDGSRLRLGSDAEYRPGEMRLYTSKSLEPSGPMESGKYRFVYEGVEYDHPKNGYGTTVEGMRRLAGARRLQPSGRLLRYVLFADDKAYGDLTIPWSDTVGANDKTYVVQTNTEVVKRCMLMSTDPGDLVLDPTSGSGTTAFVAEHWGRRWIAIDSSRVALSLARQRLLTSVFPHFAVRGRGGAPAANPGHGFVYRTVPHVTLRSIAQNTLLDAVLERHREVLGGKLADLNRALAQVTPELRRALKAKLLEKEKHEGRRAVTDADRRRWELPERGWNEWEVPFDADPEWPGALWAALEEYRKAWLAQRDEVDATVAGGAELEELVDQPHVEKGVTRVAGPFTVEAVLPAELSLLEDEFSGAPDDDLPTFEAAAEPANAEAFLDRVLRYLRHDGVRFPGNRVARFARLEPVSGTHVIHAEGEWEGADGEAPRRVAVSFGPEHGPVTSKQVEEAVRLAYKRGYNDLVFAGFSFDGAAQAAIQDDPNPDLRVHMAYIAPDVTMGDLLKAQRDSHLFTVFGLPRTSVHALGGGEYRVCMEGIDVYDPVQNTIHSTGAERVAAWFVDADYDGRTFCISQALFPDPAAWQKLSRALRSSVHESAWEALSGTESLPFRIGDNRRVAVKVIDPRGNEVVRVHRLDF